MLTALSHPAAGPTAPPAPRHLSPVLAYALAAGLELFVAGLAWLLPAPLLDCLDACEPLGPKPGPGPGGLAAANPPLVNCDWWAARRGWRGVAGRARRR